MTVDQFLEFLGPLASDPLTISLALGLFTFVLEDAATTIGALLASMHVVPVPYVLTSLYIGIVLGDFGLYWLGWLAARNEWARKFVSEERMVRAQQWLDGRLLSTLIGVRFAPGIRLPTYTGAGFLGVSFPRFAGVVLVAAAIWTFGLFGVVFFFGQMFLEAAGPWAVGVGIGITVVVIGLPHVLQHRRPKFV